jgi:hypothetical protein
MNNINSPYLAFLHSSVNVTYNHMPEAKRQIIINFWDKFYQENLSSNNDGDESKSNRAMYKEEVFQILNDFKLNETKPYNDKKLRDLQEKIENLTMKFDEKSINKSCNLIMSLMIRPDKMNAKDYLMAKLKKDQYPHLELLNELGQYTLEALIVYVICILYRSESTMVRVSTLIDHLDRHVKSHVLLVNHKYQIIFEKKEDDKNESLLTNHHIGVALVEFLVERDLMVLENTDNLNVPIQKKKGKYFLPKHLFAICNFDVSLLPIKFNLPMVCEPLPWGSALLDNLIPKYLSDLRGGYLSGITGAISRYNLLSTGDINHYYIDISHNYHTLCDVMNKLQNQPFKISKHMLTYIKKYKEMFVNFGLLMPEPLGRVNLKKLGISLRESYIHNSDIVKIYSYAELLEILHKDVNRAQYESMLLNIAEAYDDFQIYLPAFMDFRGRIYRSGILHFHERDLARSFIQFDISNIRYSHKYRIHNNSIPIQSIIITII